MSKRLPANSILATARRLGRLAPHDAQPEPALPQFSHSRATGFEHALSPRGSCGEYYVTRHAEMIATVLAPVSPPASGMRAWEWAA